MEPSWTEPPPFTWVFIGAHERRSAEGGAMFTALSGPERCWSVERRREDEHVTEGRGIMRSNKGRP
jgi:hypothetical protein